LTGTPLALHLTPDRVTIKADGYDSSITCEVRAAKPDIVVEFEAEGGDIVATDNGDPTDMTAFPEKQRKVFGGLALVIVGSKEVLAGDVVVKATSEGLEEVEAVLKGIGTS